MKSNSLIFFFVLLMTSCSSSDSTNTYQRIENFYRQFKTGNLDQYKQIIVINEDGTCLNCNNLFAKNQADALSRDSVLFIVSGYGTKIDISAYIGKNTSNLILDPGNEFGKLNLQKGCSIINLENKKIKMITPINAQNVQQLKIQFR